MPTAAVSRTPAGELGGNRGTNSRRSAPKHSIGLSYPLRPRRLLDITADLTSFVPFCRLKDSDVTWLYGPLHPGSDWEPLPKPVAPTRPTLAQANINCSYTKPILKHRSITEILCLPTAPHFDVDEPFLGETPASHEQQPSSTIPPPPSRPFLTHTKSDTHILRARTPRDALRKDSPPRVLSKESAECGLSIDESVSPGTSTGSEQDLVPHNSQSGKRKHISFNTFVEQCIAIEKPKTKRGSTRFVDEVFEDDGSVPSPFPGSLASNRVSLPLFLPAMIRIQRVSLITPTFRGRPKLIIPPPTSSIPILTQMTCWRCGHPLLDQDRHHHPVLVPRRSPLPHIPPLQTELWPSTTITGRSLISLLRS